MQYVYFKKGISFNMKKFLKRNYLLIILILIQTIIYIITGINKKYIHIDEAYSFGLTHYERVEIQDNDDFFNNWHEKSYYESYLAIQNDDIRELYTSL